jgi:hypothetical protein
MICNNGDLRDWFVMSLVGAAWTAATVFLFMHPDSGNFITWATVSATMCGVYHWIVMRDDKVRDAT